MDTEYRDYSNLLEFKPSKTDIACEICTVIIVSIILIVVILLSIGILMLL